MKIQGINNFSIYKGNEMQRTLFIRPQQDVVSFSSSYKVKTVDVVTLNCTYTNMFRDDIDWNKFVNYLDKKYADKDKVDIYCYGCSDGSEAYSLALKLKDCLGEEKASKFFPIHASDVDKEEIEMARNGSLYLHKNDLNAFRKNVTNYSFNECFALDNSKDNYKYKDRLYVPYTVKDDLRKCVEFEVNDVRSRIRKNNFKDSVIMFRNAWTFLNLNDQRMLAKNLYNNMNADSVLVIGHSDIKRSNAIKYIDKNGFIPVEDAGFVGSDGDYPSITVGLPRQVNYITPNTGIFVKK